MLDVFRRILPACWRQGALVLLVLSFVSVSTAAQAGWVLYDDFSSGSLDAAKWRVLDESSGAVTSSVTNGKLVFSKNSNTDEDVDYALYMDAIPANANGLKADILAVSSTGPVEMQLEFKIDGGQEAFGTSTEHATTCRFRNSLQTYVRWDSMGLYNTALYRQQAVDDDSLRMDYGKSMLYLNESDSLHATHTISVQVSNDYAYFLNSGARCQLLQERNDGVETMNNKRARIKFNGAAAATGTYILDNVYVHVGDLETNAPSAPKVVVVPLL